MIASEGFLHIYAQKLIRHIHLLSSYAQSTKNQSQTSAHIILMNIT